ncbi:hypothetical protein DEU56DRAFT_911854 [Suillus clintonianus]|uniref:uncharacterized protein n=1 Tax=Suillus clintonianus TaxID=1904413 RepID=UPI001B86C4F0|nr:uncharacterized protein DEU56DRAFT_911854 [Suillus clintonianus]KAG2140152.1 hypothetical protein DEU56DRAFT_911854 [Suillus clintonianus]
MSLKVDKELHSLPRVLSTAPGARPTPLAPSSTGDRVDMESPIPTLVLEKFPSFTELALISAWHDATAARHVRFQRQPVPRGHLRSAPPPTSEAENVSVSTSGEKYNASMSVPRKRRGLFARKQPVDSQKLEEKEPNISMPIRSHDFLNRAKAARSTPNLNAAAKAGAQKASFSVHPIPHEATASTPMLTQPTNAPVNQLDEVSQALGIDVNDGGIYLTFDPDWRSSSGEAVLTFLSPIPDETPSSPLVHRRRSFQSFLCVEN